MSKMKCPKDGEVCLILKCLSCAEAIKTRTGYLKGCGFKPVPPAGSGDTKGGEAKVVVFADKDKFIKAVLHAGKGEKEA